MDTLGNCEVGTGVIRKQEKALTEFKGRPPSFPCIAKAPGEVACLLSPGPTSLWPSLPSFALHLLAGVGAWAPASYP